MTNEDFSHSMDTMLNSYAIGQQLGVEGTNATSGSYEFDEYEKSLFLSQAQEDFVLSLYTGKNYYGESFEVTEELRRSLADLISEVRLDPITNSSDLPIGINSKSKFFTLPDDLWFITYEAVDVLGGRCGGTNAMEVVPITQDEYHKVKKNPFRGPNDRRSLRLDLSDGIVEIVSKYNVTSYYVRYLRRLKPIILVDLPDGLTVMGESVETPCELPDTVHLRILERAVMLALQSKGYRNTSENK